MQIPFQTSDYTAGKAPHSHVDIVSLHDAAEVLVSGEDPVETVVVDVSYNHLGGKRKAKRKVRCVLEMQGG